MFVIINSKTMKSKYNKYSILVVISILAYNNLYPFASKFKHT